MRIGEHGVREHIRLLFPALVLVSGVWCLRLILSASGLPIALVKLASVTVATTVSVLLSVILIHARRFGGYASVVVASLLINLWAQALVIFSILFGILTGTENIYSVPEFRIGANQWVHIYGHLTFGIATGTLVGAAVGCLLLWLLRTILRPRESGQ